MALFPAYADEGQCSIALEDDFEGEESAAVPIELESSLLDSPVEDPVDDGSSQTSSVGDSLIISSKKRKKKHSKKKKSKKSKKDDESERDKNDEKYKYHTLVDHNVDFYEDHKKEYGNLKVSTLYKPARPQYEYKKVILGDLRALSLPMPKKPTVRYFNRIIDFDCVPEDDSSAKTSKKRQVKVKKDSDYIDITDSGIAWSDSRIEEDLIEKTAQFNKLLHTNPYDVDVWLKYVKLQEDRMLFDIYNKRSSESTARNVCYGKQLSILKKALESNYNSVELLSKQIELSELCFTNEQYLATLKGLVSMPGLNRVLLSRMWFWYIEGVQCSMALCSISSVKEMYSAAVKALVREQGPDYQKTHTELTYRLGLFLRQAGLWEQLWMLVRSNIEHNLSKNKRQSISDVLPAVDEISLADNESVIMSSGLPSQTVWCRIETLRSHHHWLPVEDNDDGACVEDPQRQVFFSDVADYIIPLVSSHQHFALMINVIRLYKVPLFPQRHTTLSYLGQGDVQLSWEYDSVECCLPFFYSVMGCVNAGSKDPVQCKLIANIVKDFSEQPNYLDVNSNYYRFVSNLMVQSSKWFSGRETTAILIWWIRLQRAILFTLRWKDIMDQKTAFSIVRKAVKDILKNYPEDVLLFCEFAAFECQVFGLDRGLKVMETSLRCLPAERSLERTHATRCYVEMALSDSCNINRAINSLVSLALCKPLPTNMMAEVSDDTVQEALEKFASGTDSILLSLSDYDREIQLVEHLLPEESAEWLCCHVWFVFLSQSAVAFIGFCNKIRAATHVTKDESSNLESKRKQWLRESVLECVVSVTFSKLLAKEETNRDNVAFQETLFKDMLEEFPQNAAIAWKCAEVWGGSGPVGRWRIQDGLRKSDRPSAMLAVAFLFQHFVQLYRREVPSFEDSWQPGHSNRLVSLLSNLSSHPYLRRHALIWKMWLVFIAQHHTNTSLESVKSILYKGLDECPWDKGLYSLGCVHLPPQFAELIDLMVEKQIRLHTMPEELI